MFKPPVFRTHHVTCTQSLRLLGCFSVTVIAISFYPGVSNALGFYTPTVTHLSMQPCIWSNLAGLFFFPVSDALRSSGGDPGTLGLPPRPLVFSRSFNFSSLSWSALLGDLTGPESTSRHTSMTSQKGLPEGERPSPRLKGVGGERWYSCFCVLSSLLAEVHLCCAPTPSPAAATAGIRNQPPQSSSMDQCLFRNPHPTFTPSQDCRGTQAHGLNIFGVLSLSNVKAAINGSTPLENPG